MPVNWNVEYTNEFGAWWADLTETQEEDVAAVVELLSEHGHMRELRIQSSGRPIRVFYAFDPRKSAILLIGGDKTGDGRFYDRYVRLADSLYEDHLEELREEGLIE